MKRRRFVGLLTMVLLAPAGICLPPAPDFSGTWKQNGERCVPKRTGDVVRRIDQHGSELVVETTMLRAAGPPRHALQRYSLDGVSSVSTGADGDEFHTTVVAKGERLVFSVEEHEDGRVLRSKETWKLIENGAVLEVDRESLDAEGGTRKQMLLYERQAAVAGGER